MASEGDLPDIASLQTKTGPMLALPLGPADASALLSPPITAARSLAMEALTKAVLPPVPANDGGVVSTAAPEPGRNSLLMPPRGAGLEAKVAPKRRIILLGNGSAAVLALRAICTKLPHLVEVTQVVADASDTGPGGGAHTDRQAG